MNTVISVGKQVKYRWYKSYYTSWPCMHHLVNYHEIHSSFCEFGWQFMIIDSKHPGIGIILNHAVAFSWFIFGWPCMHDWHTERFSTLSQCYQFLIICVISCTDQLEVKLATWRKWPVATIIHHDSENNQAGVWKNNGELCICFWEWAIE